ncbi:MAG: cob(I)yrinic acid a,c-diamide adenosyltransferase [Armatimonadota bacterium]
MSAPGLERGIVQLYVGDGKGKTCAALGAALRALGRGLRVAVIHFQKNLGATGEHLALQSLPNPPDLRCFGLPPGPEGEYRWVDPERPSEEARKLGADCLEAVREAATSGDYDLVVGDELLDAAGWRIVTWEQILELMGGKCAQTELILTGRSCTPRVLEAADLVSAIEKVKHPYDEGLAAREGIEF